MGLWGSEIQSSHVAFVARHRLAVPGHRHDIPSWLLRLDPRLVTPADFVELRALESRKEALEALAPRRHAPTRLCHALRPWPFRQPISEADPPMADPPDAPVQVKGRFLDILA